MRGTTRKDRKRCENFPRKYSIRRRVDNRKPWSPTVGGDVTRDSRDGPSVPERDDAAPLEMSEETARTVLAHLKRRSRTLRIAPEDREDLVQDVTIWIASHREAGRPITRAWLSSTLDQFARSVRRAYRRELPLDDLQVDAEPTRAPRRPSASIEELTRELGQREKRVVELLLEGHRWESALHRLGICHGSRSRWRSRIRRSLEKVIGTLRPR